jgi:hypothetical protein
MENAPHEIDTGTAIGDVVELENVAVPFAAPVESFALTVNVNAVDVTGTVNVATPLLFVIP